MEQKRNPGSEPAIVALGGGSGLATMLRGLKHRTRNLTAIVTVADDGGGSGMLRQDLGMLPPGDIRNCMQALANVEPVMEQLLAYRFPTGSGSLTGQAFGNLLLAALNGIAPSFDQAVARMSEVLAISGRVLPVTNADIKLEALFENGTRVVGESKIFAFKKEQNCRIAQVELMPKAPPALPETLDAIAQADMILLGPGSLYTSIIPNLLVSGVSEAIRRSGALKIYVGNIMTQDGETEGMTLSEHLGAIFRHSGRGLVDYCLANSETVNPRLIARYREEDAAPLVLDQAAVAAMGVELITRPLTAENEVLARHSSERLAEAIMELYRERAETRVFTEG
ncbi:MAG: YvcK family protein [Oscillospiraceae bacterium]|nr:YvcK family protein [Oscillospiraceae bacterium]